MFKASDSIFNYVRLKHESNVIYTKIPSNNRSIIIPYQCESSFDCFPITVELYPGTFVLEVWGAQGGDNEDQSFGGLGGYSEASINIDSFTKMFLYIGGKGESGALDHHAYGGYNGGGNGARIKDYKHGGGGGSTDFRLNESIYSRILVAGGGGGAGRRNSHGENNDGGAGGGESGIKGKGDEEWGGNPGNQKEPGKGVYSLNSSADFFYGGNATFGTSSSGGGGGSGYWGGAGGHCAGGGGGSGYFASFLRGKTIDGTSPFPNYKGIEEIGHKGNGLAKITLISPKFNNLCTSNCYIKITINIITITFIFILTK